MTITDGPILDPIADVTACDYYVLGDITGTDLSGTEVYTDTMGTVYNSGDSIFVTTDLTVISDAGICSDTITFTVTITDGPVLDPIADAVACDYYVLGDITGTDLSGTEVYTDTMGTCLLYTSPSPRDRQKSRMPSSA